MKIAKILLISRSLGPCSEDDEGVDDHDNHHHNHGTGKEQFLSGQGGGC